MSLTVKPACLSRHDGVITMSFRNLIGKSAVNYVLFDAVGTLLTPSPGVDEVYHAYGRKFGSRYGVEEVGRRFCAVWSASENAFREPSVASKTCSEAEERERWRNIVATVLDDVTDSDTCFLEIFDHFAQPQAWKWDPTAVALLRQFRLKPGLRCAIASNFDARLRSIVAATEWATLFDELWISSEIGFRKPDIRFYATILEQTGCPPERMLMIGDDERNDIVPARQLGMHAALWPLTDDDFPAETRLYP